jgi:hypothetical protein
MNSTKAVSPEINQYQLDTLIKLGVFGQCPSLATIPKGITDVRLRKELALRLREVDDLIQLGLVNKFPASDLEYVMLSLSEKGRILFDVNYELTTSIQ